MPGLQSDVEMDSWCVVGLPTGTDPLVQWKLCGKQCILAPTLSAHFGIRSIGGIMHGKEHKGATLWLKACST